MELLERVRRGTAGQVISVAFSAAVVFYCLVRFLYGQPMWIWYLLQGGVIVGAGFFLPYRSRAGLGRSGRLGGAVGFVAGVLYMLLEALGGGISTGGYDPALVYGLILAMLCLLGAALGALGGVLAWAWGWVTAR